MKQKESRLTKRGQAAVTDLFIAIAVFIILITITTLTWNLYNIRLQNRFDYDDMMIKNFQITEAFVKGKGVPPDWESQTPITNLQVLGLAKAERTISEAKIRKFMDPNAASGISEDALKNTLKINLYNYYFVLRHFNGTIIANRGAFPSGNFAVNLARIVIYQEQPTILEFAIWK